MNSLFDFDIKPTGIISTCFLNRNIHSFSQAAEFIKRLPYKRNKNKEVLTTVFFDQHGTCSTKHALLKQLATENSRNDLTLMLGIFKMNGHNTPKITHTLQQYNLSYIPEAHNYLRFEGRILDYTFPNSTGNDFEQDLLEEIIIQSNQINNFKVTYHTAYLKKWLIGNFIPYSLEEIWDIRELCIQQLSKSNHT
jgi:hypothetical protein